MFIILGYNFKSYNYGKTGKEIKKGNLEGNFSRISRDFWALCHELRLLWFSRRESSELEKKIQKKKIGMFYYAQDKSFSEELVPNKTVSGVVFHVDETGEHGLVVLLHQEELPWLSDYLSVGIPKGLNGKGNTRLILEFARNKGLKAKAAEYCANYAYDGVKAGEAFLPSIKELKYLYKNKELISEKLALIKGADLFEDWYYWSSSEYSSSNAWRQYFSSGDVDYYSKSNTNYYVRPVLAF